MKCTSNLSSLNNDMRHLERVWKMCHFIIKNDPAPARAVGVQRKQKVMFFDLVLQFR